MRNDNVNDNAPDPFLLVQDFYRAAGFEPSRELAHNLIREEAKEVLKAAADLLKELCDLEYVVIGAVINQHQIDMPDDVHVAIGRVAHLFDMIPEEVRSEAFKRVHESNMSKLTNGTLLRDPETGKVLKGPNYHPPVLTDLV